MPQPRDPRASADDADREIVVQPRRATWSSIGAGVAITVTGVLMIDPENWPVWLSVIQILVGAAITADGVRHLIRRRRHLGHG